MTTTIAGTILEQVGGAGKVTAMLGAKFITMGENSLGIRFTARAKDKINHIEISLDASDTYTVKFYKIPRKAFDYEDRGEFTGVYAENLRELIETRTGLRLNL